MTRRNTPIFALVLLLLIAGVAAWFVFGNRPNRTAGTGTESVAQTPTENLRQAAPPITSSSRESTAGTDPKPGEAPAKPDKPEVAAKTTEAVKPDKPAAAHEPVYLTNGNKAGEPKLRVKLRIRVIDEFERPVPDAEITASAFGVALVREIPEGMRVSPAREHYDDTVIGRSNGEGALDVELGFRADFTEFAYLHINLSAKTALAVSPEVELEWNDRHESYNATLTMPERGGIRGRVVDGAGLGVATVMVVATESPKSKQHLGAVFTDVSGYFELVNLPPGTISLVARGDFYRGELDYVIATVHPNVVAGLDRDIVVHAITRYTLKLLLPDDVYKHGGAQLTYFGAAGKISNLEAVWFNDFTVRLMDPPEGATAVEIKVLNCESLRIDLPPITPRQVIELGDFRLTREPPDEENAGGGPR
ncbi:MAG: carboxypeptidase regulatory-like domain-containing protein [Planctomycetes bacterium]|nr:carboxypeptidase regulatory-like domain-containing protein [Planctomycetota bacterium]